MAIPNIDEIFQPTHDERARQSFVSMLRKQAIIDMRIAVKNDYETRLEPDLSSRGTTPKNWRDIEAIMKPELLHSLYSSIRYNAQEMCYLSVQPAVERALPKMIAIAKDLAAHNPTGGSLRLNSNLTLPKYVTALDVHLTPGWATTEHTTDDVAQGAVISFGGKVFTGQHPYRKRAGVVGESIAHWLKVTRPGFTPSRILDLGTTVGKNLLPYKSAFPAAEVHGIDCGAPVLRYAHAVAEHEGLAVHFSQQNAEATDFPDGHFDLIVSSFFLHEIPVKSTRIVLKECMRLLRPGGVMVHMELPNEAAVSDYDNFFWNWDTLNNNEPNYTNFRAQDPVELCVVAGFARETCFNLVIPDASSFGSERYQQFLRGEIKSPPHGSGGWFILGAQKIS